MGVRVSHRVARIDAAHRGGHNRVFLNEKSGDRSEREAKALSPDAVAAEAVRLNTSGRESRDRGHRR